MSSSLNTPCNTLIVNKVRSRSFLALLFVLLSYAVQAAPKMEKSAMKNITYASVDGRDLNLDIYLPTNKNKSQKPHLVIWIHGGAWRSGSKEDPPLSLLSSGFAMASVGYRLSVEAPFPAMVHDIKAAIRYLRANADKYGYQSENIAIWGSSSGGHLVTLVGSTSNHTELEGDLGDFTQTSSSVQAVVDYYGPTNFLTIIEQSTPHGISVRVPALELLLGKPVEQLPELAKLASPVYHVNKNGPPLLIMHGDQDIQVPINQSHELEGAYKALNLPVKMVVVHGAGHFSPDYYSSEYMAITTEFLKNNLK